LISKLLLKIPTLQEIEPFVRFEVNRHMSPSFFIVGFQKCGTTTLYDSIMQHPRVIPGITKKNNILAEKKERLNEFRLCFPIKKTGKITGDASHLHTWMPYGLERIKSNFPKAKVLVIMRDPVVRAFSHFNMDKRIGYIPKLMDFEKFVKIELELRNGISENFDADEVYEHMRFYGNKYGWPLSRGIYHLYLEKLKNLDIPFHSIFLEELQSDFQGTMNGVLNFLEIEEIDVFQQRSNSGDYKEMMNSATNDLLNEFYKEPNQRLSRLLDRKLPWA
jgi:hypothetical protein